MINELSFTENISDTNILEQLLDLIFMFYLPTNQNKWLEMINHECDWLMVMLVEFYKLNNKDDK